MSEASGRGSIAGFRVAIAGRLRARREEIDEAVIHRTFSVAPATGSEVPGYAEALRAAIPSAVDYALSAIELGEERTEPTPEAIFVQTAASAKSGVGLETVVRRYTAGYSTLCDFLHQEVLALGGAQLTAYAALQRDLTALFERLVIEVTESYRSEEARAVPSPRERQVQRIRRLLAGELVDPGDLDYPMGGSHLAAIVSGEDPEAVAASLAARLGVRLLIGESSTGRCAFWLGGTHPLDAAAIDAASRTGCPESYRLSWGEPGLRLAGWRRTRRQAESAELIGRRGGGGVVRYRDVALMAAAVRDPDLAQFLNETYVKPLEDHQGVLSQTLRTFLRLDGNASSAAAALGIARQTVASRLRLAEKRLGCAPGQCAAQLETALRLAALGEHPPPW